MGLYDTFVSKDEKVWVQLKNGECLMHTYAEGDVVDPGEFPDAFYYSPEGVVVIRGGKVESVTEEAPVQDPARVLPCLTKWGGLFSPETGDSLSAHNPIAQGMRAMGEALVRASKTEPGK